MLVCPSKLRLSFHPGLSLGSWLPSLCKVPVVSREIQRPVRCHTQIPDLSVLVSVFDY